MKTGRCVQCGRSFTAAERGRPRRYCGRACQARAYRARRDVARRPATTARPATGTRPAPIRRTPTRSELVRVAVGLADVEGIARVSMRTVAARSGVPVMSLYRRLSGKDELVAAMVDAVLCEGWEPSSDDTGDWRAKLEHEARQEWRLYQQHPWVLSVLATPRPPIGQSVLDGVDRSMTALTDAGLGPDTALAAYLTISGYVQGAALLPVAETDAVRHSALSSGVWWGRRLGRLAGAIDSGRYPWLTELATLPAARGPTDEDLRAWFEFGLQRVLDGIGLLLDT